jgi:hypothetical protein
MNPHKHNPGLTATDSSTVSDASSNVVPFPLGTHLCAPIKQRKQQKYGEQERAAT